MTTDQGPYPAQYPVQFAVEYPDRPLNRLTSFFRIFVIIPIWIVLGTVSGATWEWAGGHSSMAYGGAGAGGLLFLGPLLMILFRQKYPRWWFDWNLELQRFINRVWTYLVLVNDNYRPPMTTSGSGWTTPIRTPLLTSTGGCHWSNGCSPFRTTSCCSSWTSRRSSW